MGVRQIVMMVLLGILLAVCFLSGRIARWMLKDADEKAVEKRSLLIKLAAALIVAVMYLVTFLS